MTRESSHEPSDVARPSRAVPLRNQDLVDQDQVDKEQENYQKRPHQSTDDDSWTMQHRKTKRRETETENVIYTGFNRFDVIKDQTMEQSQ